jgi:hypothetical protein
MNRITVSIITFGIDYDIICTFRHKKSPLRAVFKFRFKSCSGVTLI